MRHAVLAAISLFALLADAHASQHAIYFDALGRGGLWGLGYDFQWADRFTTGTTASFYYLDSQQVLTLSPYVTFYPFLNGEHRWLFQVGPQIVREATQSPVPEWDGISTTGVSAAFATGYEYRADILLRAYGMLAIGHGQISPWLGFSIGWTF